MKIFFLIFQKKKIFWFFFWILVNYCWVETGIAFDLFVPRGGQSVKGAHYGLAHCHDSESGRPQDRGAGVGGRGGGPHRFCSSVPGGRWECAQVLLHSTHHSGFRHYEFQGWWTGFGVDKLSSSSILVHRGKNGPIYFQISRLMDRSFDWLIVWLIDWVSECLFGWLIDWLSECSIDRLIDWLIDRLFGWLIDWLVDRLFDWLNDWVSECSIDWLILHDMFYFVCGSNERSNFFQWMNNYLLAVVDVTERLHIVDIRNHSVLDSVDLSFVGLTYQSSFYKGLATTRAVSQAMVKKWFHNSN